MKYNPTLQSKFQAAAAVCYWLLLSGSGQPALSDDVANVEPFIVEPTCIVVKVDTSRLTLPESFEQLAAPFSGGNLPPGVADAARQWIDALRKGADSQAIYATIGIPSSDHDLAAFLFVKDTPQIDKKTLLGYLGDVKDFPTRVHKGMLVTVPKPAADLAAQLDELIPSPRKELRQAFEAVADYPVQVLLLPPDFVRRTLVEMQPTLPPVLGGGPGSVLTEGLLWAALGMDPGNTRLEVVVQSASARAAHDLCDYLPKLLDGVYQAQPAVQRRIPRETFAGLAPLITSTVEGDRLVIRLAGPETVAKTIEVLAPTAAALKGLAHQRANVNKFKQLMLAMHNYHFAHNVFPPRDEARDKAGKLSLSWRVHILPFVDQQKLYGQFHLDEPWDSAHNKTLIGQMPDVFKGGEIGLAPGHTTFQVPVGEGAAFGGPKAPWLSQISDGSSNTIAVVQVKAELAVPWTAPQDYAFDPAAPGRDLFVDSDGLFLAAMFDGSVRRLSITVKPEMLLRLFQISDGQPIDWTGF